MNLHYVSKELRDQAARDAARRGIRRMRKSSSRGITLSPDYVIGYTGPRYDNGFGGTEPTYFAVVYNLEVNA